MSYEAFVSLLAGLAIGCILGFYVGWHFHERALEKHFKWIKQKKEENPMDFLEGCGPNDIKDDYWWNNGEKPKNMDY